MAASRGAFAHPLDATLRIVKADVDQPDYESAGLCLAHGLKGTAAGKCRLEAKLCWFAR